MKKVTKKARILAMTLGTLTLTGLAGCAQSIDFSSPSPLGEGVRGKVWRTPTFVDEDMYIPEAMTGAPAALRAFDVASNGTQAQVVGNWHDQRETQYKGYARLYNDSTGWAAPGPSFGQIAALSTGDIGFPSIAAGPGGIFMANFFRATATTGNVISTTYSGSSWRSFPQATLAPVVNAALSSTTQLNNAPRAVSTMDSIGRGYTFFIDGDSNGVVYGLTWQQANPEGVTTTPQASSSAAAARFSGVTTQFDGSNHVCVTYELSSGALNSRCLDVFATTTANFSAATEQSLASSGVAGHETATDGEGNVMAVFYKSTTSGYHVYSNLGAAGTWSTSITQLDAAVPSTYSPPSPAQIDGARPGVAYVGEGRFLAAWVGVDSTSTPKSTSVFYSLYDPDEGWSDAEEIPGTSDPYNSTPHAQALHVFGNKNGNAGIALGQIHTTEAIAPNAAATANIYPENIGARTVRVARWQIDDGWLTAATVGNVCYTQTNTAIATTDFGCTHRPTGVVLDSGNSLVFFMDRDNNASSTSPGNRRLSVVEFN